MKNEEDDSIFNGVVKVLEDTKHLHTLDITEYVTIATLVSAIAHSSRMIRGIFYSEAVKIARVLDQKQDDLRKQAGDILRKYRSVWGDEELGEDICRMLDEEDAAAAAPNDNGAPKKKVSN